MSPALAIKDELRRELPPLIKKIREPAKVVALKVGTTPRSTEGHKQEEQLPSLAVGLAYGKMYPEIRKLFDRLMDAEMGDTPESPQQLASEIAQFLLTRGK